MIIVLDTGVIGELARPNPNRDVSNWMVGAVQRGREFVLPEICDYELRRELVRERLEISLKALDDLAQGLTFLPLNTIAFRRAAQLWAQVRNAGAATASDESLDADCILAAQALAYGEASGRPVTVATTNSKHLSRMLDARDWASIP